MALSNKKYSAVHSKTGSDKAKLQANYDDGHINTFIDLAEDGVNPEFGALIYQIQEMQDELDYLRTEIALNKAKSPIATGANTVVSFGDMVSTTVKGKTTYSIVMTVVFTDPVSSKVTTKTTTLTLA